jgi:GAF domain-containing protein
MHATAQNEIVIARDLTRDERWPYFARAAMNEGFKSVLAIPLSPVDGAMGALVLYSSSVDAFDAETEELAIRLARQAAIAIANSGSFVQSEQSNDQLREALASRDIIGQAKGILMERSDVSADEAFDQMREQSQRGNRKLRDIAEDIVQNIRKRKRS